MQSQFASSSTQSNSQRVRSNIRRSTSDCHAIRNRERKSDCVAGLPEKCPPSEYALRIPTHIHRHRWGPHRTSQPASSHSEPTIAITPIPFPIHTNCIMLWPCATSAVDATAAVVRPVCVCAVLCPRLVCARSVVGHCCPTLCLRRSSGAADPAPHCDGDRSA